MLVLSIATNHTESTEEIDYMCPWGLSGQPAVIPLKFSAGGPASPPAHI